MAGMQPTVVRAERNMAATSHPLATATAMDVLDAGGSACDAAVAAAAVLCVVEPMSTGVGGDMFALVWHDEGAVGLNASGRAAASIDPDALSAIDPYAPSSVTVPGAVSGWVALLARFGRLGLDRCLAAAIDIAERGFEVTPGIARAWRDLAPAIASDPELSRCYLPAPEAGDRHQNAVLGGTLRAIADRGWDAIATGAIAEALCAVTCLEPVDLAAHRVEWVSPIGRNYRDVTVLELPPNGWGAAALQAIGIVDGVDVTTMSDLDRCHLQAEALKLAFADAGRYIADAPLPAGYLDEAYLAARRELIDPSRARNPPPGELPIGGTVYLCVVDDDGMACSFIQSTYHGFGARIGVPGTGIALHNRGAGFTLESGHPNRLAPGRRPFHTIIPALLVAGDDLLGPFGVMGAHMQAQGHLQVVMNMVDRGMDPQQALNAPRLRCDPARDGWALALEQGLWGLAPELERRGHRIVRDPDPAGFGGGQIILRAPDGSLLGGSDPRKDGCAAGS